MAKVDATAHTALTRKYKVSSYPTINVYRNGNPDPVHTKLSQRTQHDLTEFVKAVHLGLPIKAQPAKKAQVC